MAAPLVLFVPGYPEVGNAAQLSHRFAHALAVGGAGDPVVVERAQTDVVWYAPHVESNAFPGSGAPALGAGEDERSFYREAHQSILESNPQAIRAPAQAALHDPHLAGADDPEIGVLRTYFGLMHHYASQQAFRYQLQDLFRQAVGRNANRALLVVAHGFGGLVAYDALFKMGPSAPPLDLLTVGSPLGLRVTQRRFKAKARGDSHYPIPERVRRWTNVAVVGDPVCADPTLGDEFRWTDEGLRIEDRQAKVDTGWPFHRWEGYLRSAPVRQAVGEFLRRA